MTLGPFVNTLTIFHTNPSKHSETDTQRREEGLRDRYEVPLRVLQMQTNKLYNLIRS